LVMFLALLIFLAGTKTYRFYPIQEESPFGKCCKLIVALVRGRERNDTE
jgi:POT family